MSRVGPYLALLRGNRDFTRLYVAQLISFAGDWFATVALLGLVLEMTGSAVAASIVIVLQTAGLAFLSPLGGVLADRLDRRRLMVGADLVRIPIALMPLLARDPSTIWIALLGVFLLSAAGAGFEPASSAALPNLVDKDELSRANVLIGSAWGTMLAIGAALGGIVAATLGRDATFVINAISFGVSASLIIGIRRSFQQPRGVGDSAPESANPLKAIGSALGYARGSRAIASFLLSKSTFGVGTGVVLMLAIFGRQLLPEGDLGIGVLYASRGLGALAGPFIARSVFGLEHARADHRHRQFAGRRGGGLRPIAAGAHDLVRRRRRLDRASRRWRPVDAVELRPPAIRAGHGARPAVRFRLRPGHADRGHLDAHRRHHCGAGQPGHRCVDHDRRDGRRRPGLGLVQPFPLAHTDW